MKFRKKQTPIVSALPTVRRRPGAVTEPPAHGQAFSYYSQRSTNESNIGRRSTTFDKESDSTRSSNRSSKSSSTASANVFRPQNFKLYLVLIAVAGVFGLYAMLLSPSPRVILLQDQTTAYFLQDKAVYGQSAERTLAGSIFNKNKLTVDSSAVSADILAHFPEVKQAIVVLPVFGHQPKLYIEPYKPAFIVTTLSGGAFLLDTTGRALVMTNQIQSIDKLQLATVEDRSASEVKLGSQALPSTTVSFITTVIEGLKAEQVTAASLVLPAAAYELDVKVMDASYTIKYNLMNDPLQQTGTYLAARGRLRANKVQPSSYIDLRVAGRVYYK